MAVPGRGPGGPRVLHVAQPTDGGVAGYLAAAVDDQVRRGWQVTVVAPVGGRLDDLLAGSGAERHDWPAGRSPDLRTASEVLRLRTLVATAAPDLVHLHSSKAGLAGRLALRGAVPTVFQPHGWSWLAVTGGTATASLAWERYAARWTDLCICVGEGELGQAAAARVGGSMVVVRNGVDLRRFAFADQEDRAASRSVLGLPPDVPLVVCPGRVAWQKGQDVLLRAWPAVRSAVPDSELAVVGEGELRVSAPAVHAPGAVADVRTWLAAADVVVFPSRWEGLSMGLLEAMAVGRSTVVSAVAGLAEAVDESTGATVPPESPEELAAAITARLSDPALAAREGAAAAARAGAEFDIGATFDRLAAETLRLLRTSRRRLPASPSPEQLPDRLC